MNPFPTLEKGRAPTFIEAALANAVLRLLNGLILAKVVPAGAGKFVVAPDTFVLDLSPMQAATQAQQISDLTKALAQTQGVVAGLIASLKGATISSTAACDPSTSAITVVTTLTIPELP